VRKIVSTSWSLADEDLHTSLRADICVILCWPCHRDLLPSCKLRHRRTSIVPS
jgi:hypothetical protein